LARQKRIEFAGAFYHVTSRGNRRQTIFISDDDRLFFLNSLREVCEKHGAIIHAYCLMSNHYHLFMETLRGSLSKIMHDINTAYAVYFNKKHELVGHPFQGRYKAILVQAEAYARDLAAYIHLNPVKAKVVERPEDYAWSNYREYIGPGASQSWTSTSLVLSQFSSAPDVARNAYRTLVLQRISQNVDNPLKSASAVGIMGDSEFIGKIKAKYLIEPKAVYDRELPQVNKLLPQPRLDDIRIACESLFCRENRYSRKVAIFLSHKMTRLPLKEIGDFYAISISGITDICRRIRREIISNDTLAGTIAAIEKRISDNLIS